ncbi:suppressor of fused domain protein [Priestia megaterium]|uniref:suppressor of fused domain protein n=1 Tax=Priestia megaterium TaxID=1404 RepID=UPI002FFF96F3
MGKVYEASSLLAYAKERVSRYKKLNEELGDLMKIWKMYCTDEAVQLTAKNKQKNEDFFDRGLMGESLQHSWESIVMETFQEGEYKDYITYKGRSNPPIFSQKATQHLDRYLTDSAEILQVVHNDDNYYAINITNILECIDYENSIPNKFGGFEQIAFIENELKKSHIFRTKSTKHRFGDFPIISQEIYVSDDVRDYILQSDLTGFTFYEVWSSQEAEASVEELNPFVRESLDEDVEAHLQAYYGPIIRRVEAESAEVTEAGFYEMAPTESVPFYTVATHGYSTLRLPTPPGLDSAYVELVMHADQDPFEDKRYSWIPQVMHQVGSFAVNHMNWIGQWMVFPNQELDRYVDTYERTLTGEKVKLPLQVQPYSPESGFCGVMVVPPLPQCQEAFMMPYLENGKETHGEWPVYFHTLLPLYEEEMEYYFQHGQEALLEKMMENGIEHLFNLHRPNTFKEKRKGFFGRFNK